MTSRENQEYHNLRFVLCCVTRMKPIRCEINKLQTVMVIMSVIMAVKSNQSAHDVWIRTVNSLHNRVANARCGGQGGAGCPRRSRAGERKARLFLQAPMSEKSIRLTLVMHCFTL